MTRRFTTYMFLILLGAGLVGCASTGGPAQAPAGPVSITGVNVEDYAVELNFSDGVSPSYTIQKPADPYLAVVEMPGSEAYGIPDVVPSAAKGITEVRVLKVDDPAEGIRIEVLMDEPAGLEAEVFEGLLVLSLAEEMPAEELVAEEMPAEEPVAEEMPAAEPEVVLAEATAITSVDFDYSDRHKRLVIMGDGPLTADVFTLDHRIVLDVPGVEMMAEVPDTVVAPVKGIRQGVHLDKVRIVVDLVQKRTEFVASTEGNRVILAFPMPDLPVAVSATPPIPAARVADADTPAEKTLGAVQPLDASGAPMARGAATVTAVKLISLDFQDADVKPIVRLLAGDVAGYNVVLHPSVKGSINLRLKDVPWDKALDIVLKQNSLERQTEENIMWIAPASIFREQEEEEARRRQTYEKVAELVQEIIPLRYVDAEEMKNRIEEAKLKSPRGQIRIDSRTNNLIINDTLDNIRRIKTEEIPYWDTPQHGTMQVLIEAKIVEVNSDYQRNLGIRWSGSHTRNSQGGTDEVSSDFGINTPLRTTDVAQGAVLTSSIIEVGSVSTVEVNLSLEALETMRKSRNLASPKVLTIDREPASIKQGVQIPYSTIEDGTAKTEFQEAVLKLDVTPEIQPNGIVKLNVEATNDSPTQVGGETGINSQEITTTALVKDGETLVLGGIYTNTEAEIDEGVPVLSRIPLLGWLFKTKTTLRNPTELLVFITPRIIR
jgi:type IV pilus secretin PilQ/predicted competence protein